MTGLRKIIKAVIFQPEDIEVGFVTPNKVRICEPVGIAQSPCAWRDCRVCQHATKSSKSARFNGSIFRREVLVGAEVVYP